MLSDNQLYSTRTRRESGVETPKAPNSERDGEDRGAGGDE